MALVEMTFPCLDSCGGGYGFKGGLFFFFFWKYSFVCQRNADTQSKHLKFNLLCHRERDDAYIFVSGRQVIYFTYDCL